MKLLKGTIRPGNVVEVFDNGNIKASAPGLFSFTDDPSKMPPIMPWQIGSNCNSYTKPRIGDDVWIMNFADNPLQLFWFRKDHASDCNNIDFSEKNVEVLCNRNMSGEWATIYLSDGSGWIISKGESIMQIRPDGSIKLDTGFNHRVIDINTKGISLGSEGKSAHPAAYGDETVNTFNALSVLLRSLAFEALKNPYTAPIGMSLLKDMPNFEKNINNIPSSHVSLD
jgi:hypothetical protein